MEPAIAFRVREHERPGLEVRINFGLLTGRDVTPAEIDHLARALRPLADTFEIVSEDRHEFGGAVEASLHQVVVAIGEADDEAAIRVVEAAEQWARACFDARHSDLTEL
jgi:hypothetical protein